MKPLITPVNIIISGFSLVVLTVVGLSRGYSFNGISNKIITILYLGTFVVLVISIILSHKATMRWPLFWALAPLLYLFLCIPIAKTIVNNISESKYLHKQKAIESFIEALPKAYACPADESNNYSQFGPGFITIDAGNTLVYLRRRIK
jgi:hypothetical protein